MKPHMPSYFFILDTVFWGKNENLLIVDKRWLMVTVFCISLNVTYEKSMDLLISTSRFLSRAECTLGQVLFVATCTERTNEF
jgi:hypothetical protein